jgi:hypothetical protein
MKWIGFTETVRIESDEAEATTAYIFAETNIYLQSDGRGGIQAYETAPGCGRWRDIRNVQTFDGAGSAIAWLKEGS